MNEILMFLGAGIALGAGTPIIFHQDHSRFQIYLNFVGLFIVIIGGIL